MPIPVNEKKASFLAMTWLVKTAKEKDSTRHFPQTLAKDLIDASNNQVYIS